MRSVNTRMKPCIKVCTYSTKIMEIWKSGKKESLPPVKLTTCDCLQLKKGGRTQYLAHIFNQLHVR